MNRRDTNCLCVFLPLTSLQHILIRRWALLPGSHPVQFDFYEATNPTMTHIHCTLFSSNYFLVLFHQIMLAFPSFFFFNF